MTANMTANTHDLPLCDGVDIPVARATSGTASVLPAADADAATAASVSTPAASGITTSTADAMPLTVLVVDDDPAALRLIAKITSSAGYRVLEASDGRQALDCVLAECPDMVVTDWDMPGLDGLQFCRRIRGDNLPFYVYVLLLTAKSSCEEMIEGLDAGADDFISKPINRAVLLARLKAGSRSIAVDRRLRDMARLDPLTGLPNRRSFLERFSAEWERASRHGRPLSCAMIDLDFFKRINDTHGHAAGDAALQGIARLLETRCRVSDIVARNGGEEFCALLAETDEPGAAAWAERTRLAIAEARIPFARQILSVTASLGVAARLPDIADPAGLVDLADQALRVAKELGRNRVVAFSTLDDGGSDASHPSATHAPLDNVLARDVMAPAVYQPHQDDTVGQVADLFLQLRINAAPVVDDEGRLLGIVSESDLLAVAATNCSLNMPVRDCMRTSVVQYDEDTPAKDVFRFLSRAAVPRVVVVREARPTGVISRATLLRWLRNWSDLFGQSDDDAGTAPVPIRRAGILKAADAASERIAALRHYLATHDSNIMPCAVAEATRLEDLAHNILAHCRGLDPA